MNGIGIGTSVGLGTLIGLYIVAPGIEITEVFATLFFYGLMSGFLFEIYRFALRGWKPPFFGKRD
jgi:hypothetical protein